MSKVRHRGTVKQVIFTSIISLCQQARNSGVWFSIFYMLYIACLYVHVIKQDKLKAEAVRYRQCLESSLFSGILYIFNKLSFTVATVGIFSDFWSVFLFIWKKKLETGYGLGNEYFCVCEYGLGKVRHFFNHQLQ